MIAIIKRKYGPVLIILVCSLIVLIIMQPWNLYFRNDDFDHIPNDNLLIQHNFLRPVSNFFLACDKWIFNKKATGYFFTTYILHTACTISVYYLCRQVLRRYAFNLPANTALFTAIIFLFYPFHAEPLFWIISRGSIIAALFAILSLYFYLKKNEDSKYLLLAWLTLVVALFTYESMWNVLFFYCLISFFNIRSQLSQPRKEYLHTGIFMLTFLLYFIIRFFSLDTITGGYESIDKNMSRISVLLINLVKLVARNFTPPFYNQFYSIAFFVVSVIVYTLLTVVMFKKNKAVAWLMIILVFGVITAVITATPLGIDTHRNESERYIYYSSFFFCFFLTAATSLVHEKSLRYAINAVIIISGIIGLITYQANYKYASIVVKTTTQFVKKYKAYKNAYFIDVPEEYKGALIFRTCLQNAIEWISPECAYDSVRIVTKIKEASGLRPYQTGEKTWEELCSEKSSVAHRGMYALTDSSNRYILLTKQDVVFWYANKGFYKVNRP